MCLQDEMERLGLSDLDENSEIWPLHSDFLHTQIQNWKKASTCDQLTHLGDSFPVSICFLRSILMFFPSFFIYLKTHLVKLNLVLAPLFFFKKNIIIII